MTLSDAPAAGLRDVAPFPAPAAQHPAADTALDNLRARFLRAGREDLDDRELLQLLLAGSHPAAEASQLATRLLDTLGSPARVLAARPDTLRAVAGLIGIGGHLTMPPLPHHRAYGSVPRRFDRIRPQGRAFGVGLRHRWFGPLVAADQGFAPLR